MAERRFAALADLKKRSAADGFVEPSQLAQAVEITPSAPSSGRPVIQEAVIAGTAGQGRGRPPGKRSDPGWKPRTILMRTKTHRQVSGILIEQDDGPDLSELIDALLSEWVAKQR